MVQILLQQVCSGLCKDLSGGLPRLLGSGADAPGSSSDTEAGEQFGHRYT